MTDSHFDLFLEGGRMQLKRKHSNPDSDPGNPQWIEVEFERDKSPRYETAQSAVERAFSKIAHQTNRTEGGEPNESAMVKAFNERILRLDISGHQREILVAALHLHVRYGIDLPGATDSDDHSGALRYKAGGLYLNPLKDALDPYATFRFDSDLRPLEALRSMLDQWIRLSERDPRISEKAKESHPHWREILGLSGRESKPLRVVITGVTGAGKSTFINGILGREVVPHSSQVCTAGVLHLRHPHGGERESIKVYWHPPADLETLKEDLQERVRDLERDYERLKNFGSETARAASLIEELKTKGGSLVAKFGSSSNAIGTDEAGKQIQKNLADYRQRLSALEAARQYWNRGEPTDEELSNLSKFSKAGPDSFAEATAKIEVFIEHPLLKLIEIVDAPGLRDGSDERQKTLLRALEGETAWLYLIPATNRANTAQEDWKYIQSRVNNGSGILVLTKADTQPPDDGVTLVKTIQDRIKNHRENLGWSRPAVWCSALLTSEMAAIEPEAIEGHIENDAFQQLAVLLEYPKRKTCNDRYARYLESFARLNPEHLLAARDYIFDSSRLPSVMRAIGTVLLEDTIEIKVRRGHDEIMTGVKDALRLCRESIADADSILKAHDVILELQKQSSEIQEALSKARADLEWFEDNAKKAVSSISSACQGAKVDFNHKLGEKHQNLWSDVKEAYDKDMKHCLWGSFKYELHDFFLSETFTNSIKSGLENLKLSVSVQLWHAAQNRGERIAVSEACAWSFTEVKTIKGGEAIWESSSNARKRVWYDVKDAAPHFQEKMGNKFSEIVGNIERLAGQILESRRKDLENKINEYQSAEISIQTQIEENDPKETRRMAEENLASFREHQSAFEQFLKDLQSQCLHSEPTAPPRSRTPLERSRSGFLPIRGRES